MHLCFVIKPPKGLGGSLVDWLPASCAGLISPYVLGLPVIPGIAPAPHTSGCCAGMGSDYVIEPPSTLAALDSDDDRADDDDEAPLNREVNSLRCGV